MLDPYPKVKDKTPVPCATCGQLFLLPTRDLAAERKWIVIENVAQRESYEARLAAGQPNARLRLVVERDWYCSLDCSKAAGLGAGEKGEPEGDD